jgi:hypothetical protein
MHRTHRGEQFSLSAVLGSRRQRPSTAKFGVIAQLWAAEVKCGMQSPSEVAEELRAEGYAIVRGFLSPAETAGGPARALERLDQPRDGAGSPRERPGPYYVESNWTEEAMEAPRGPEL